MDGAEDRIRELEEEVARLQGRLEQIASVVRGYRTPDPDANGHREGVVVVSAV